MATRHPELDPQERLELTSRRIERPPRPVPGVGRLWKDLGGLYVGNAFIGLLFAATGPVAVILSVGRQGGLTQEQLAHSLFPLGDTAKPQIRAEAAARGLLVADKPDVITVVLESDGRSLSVRTERGVR